MVNNSDNKDTNELIDQIRKTIQIQDYSDCEKQITKGMQLLPHSPVPYNLMGILLIYLHQPLKAQKYFRMANILDPQYLPAKHNLDLCTSMKTSGNWAYQSQDCEKPERENPWIVVFDEKGIGHTVRRNKR